MLSSLSTLKLALVLVAEKAEKTPGTGIRTESGEGSISTPSSQTDTDGSGTLAKTGVEGAGNPTRYLWDYLTDRYRTRHFEKEGLSVEKHPTFV